MLKKPKRFFYCTAHKINVTDIYCEMIKAGAEPDPLCAGCQGWETMPSINEISHAGTRKPAKCPKCGRDDLRYIKGLCSKCYNLEYYHKNK